MRRPPRRSAGRGASSYNRCELSSRTLARDDEPEAALLDLVDLVGCERTFVPRVGMQGSNKRLDIRARARDRDRAVLSEMMLKPSMSNFRSYFTNWNTDPCHGLSLWRKSGRTK